MPAGLDELAYYGCCIETVDDPKFNNRPLRIELKGLISVTKFEHGEDKTRSLYQNKLDTLWLPNTQKRHLQLLQGSNS